MKLKAFTIIEAVISMVIMCIILSIIFIIFSVTSQRLNDFKKQNEKTTDLNRMSYAFNKDIFNSTLLYSLDDEIYFEDYKSTKISYSIVENDIIRSEADFKDTFKIGVNKMLIDTLSSKTGKIKYQRLKILIKEGEEKTDLNFFKRLYPADLIKKNTDAYGN